MSVGYFGKLPQRADFVVSGLPESFLAPMDRWLRQGLQGGNRAWSFALTSGVAGPEPMVGVMTPSRDRAGREFPLLIARAAPPGLGAATLAAASASWLDRAGRAAREAATGILSPGELDVVLRRTPSPSWPTAQAASRREDCWSLEAGGGLALALPVLLDAAAGLRRASLWWGVNNCLLTEGLPPPSRILG